MAARGRIIYGGSFNPLHIGHMRLALEACAMLEGLVTGLDFLPAAMPPHKPAAGLLPFGLRCELIEAAISLYPQFACNRVEAQRQEPSYTYKTLGQLRQTNSGQLYFLLGSQDFLLLPQWFRGLQLPDECTLVIAPRGEYSRDAFLAQVCEFWPGAEEQAGLLDACTGESCAAAVLTSGAALILLPVPPLDISSSRIRKLWLCRKNIDYLVPGPVQQILNDKAQAVCACWQETGRSCSM